MVRKAAEERRVRCNGAWQVQGALIGSCLAGALPVFLAVTLCRVWIRTQALLYIVQAPEVQWRCPNLSDSQLPSDTGHLRIAERVRICEA